MEIKKGDIVMVPRGIPIFYRRYNSIRLFEGVFSVVDIEDGLALLSSVSDMYTAMLPTKYLINTKVAKQSDFLKDCDPMEHRKNLNERLRQQQLAHSATVAEFSNKDFDWQRYQADLAREIALKVANRYNDPEETAEYASKAAKQIVKRLKENK